MLRQCVLRWSSSPFAPFSSSASRPFLKDVYKEINYEAPFDEHQRQVILSLLRNAKNPEELNALGVPKTLTTSVLNHMTHVNVLEHLLDVRQIDVTRFERLCKAILKRAESGVASNESVHLKLTRLEKCIYPEPVADFDSICALKFDLYSLGFARLAVADDPFEPLRLVDWGTLELFENPASAAEFRHDRLHAKALQAKERLTKMEENAGSVYLFESAATPKKNLPAMATTLIYRNLIFQAALLSLINGDADSVKAFEMAPQILNDLFNLRVGLERTAILDRLQNLSAEFSLRIDADIFRDWREFPRQRREQMATAVLMANAYFHIRQQNQ